MPDERFPNGKLRRKVECECLCGNRKIILWASVCNGHTTTCGCKVKEKGEKAIGFKHGKRESKIYGVWCGIKRRCYNPNERSFPLYGGRGIKMSNSWKDFKNFYNDMGDPPKGMSIERKDVNGDYNKKNCKWATLKEQCNNRRSNHKINYNGKILNIKEWENLLGFTKGIIYGRLQRRGWNLERTMSTPMRKFTGRKLIPST